MRLQAPAERQQALNNLDAHLSDFLTDSCESALFTTTERHEIEREAENCREHCQALLVSLETGKKVTVYVCVLIMLWNHMTWCSVLFLSFSGEGWVGLSCLPLRAAEHQVTPRGGREQADARHTDSTPQHNIRRCCRQCSSHSRARGKSDQHNYSLYWAISGQSVLQFLADVHI